MFRRATRVLSLAVAAWAVLFAPGAAGADAVHPPGADRADHVAASVLAPTFEVDSVGRPPQTCAAPVQDEAPSSGGPVGRSERNPADEAAVIARAGRHDRWFPVEGGERACIARRGPPAS